MSRMTTSASARSWPSRPRLADGHGIFLRRLGIDRDVELLAEHVQLVDGRGPLQVGRDEQRLSPALSKQRRACRRWSFCRSPAGRTSSGR